PRLDQPRRRTTRIDAVCRIPAGRRPARTQRPHRARRRGARRAAGDAGRHRVGDERLPLPQPVDRRLARRCDRDARRRAAATAIAGARPDRTTVPAAGDGFVNRQSGVALLTVLLLVAVMSVLVMSVLDDIRFGLRRASNAQSMAQAQWYALGAETLAMAQIEKLSARDPGRTTLVGDWNDRPLVFPVEHGTISARLSDATTCFNLNSVVMGAPELWQRN